MTQPATVSVVMCAYNAAAYLPAALDSLLTQTHPPDEFVALDDGSTDATHTLLQAFAARAPFPVRVLRSTHNLGYNASAEKAFTHCAGSLIVNLDADDVMFPERIARLVAALASGAALVVSDAVRTTSALVPYSRTLWQYRAIDAAHIARVTSADPLPDLLRLPIGWGATMAFRADLLPLALPFVAQANADEWLAFFAAVYRQTTAVETPLLYYRQHASNLTGTVERGWRARLAWALRSSRPLYAQRAAYFAALRARLRERGDAPPGVLAHVERALAHWTMRTTLDASRVRRLAPVMRDLAAGHYAAYSEGWRSAAKDIVAD